MPKYSYKAINETGSGINGVIEADSIDGAGNILNARGLIPVKIVEQSASFSLFIFIKDNVASVNPRDLIIFTKQFRTMSKSGVPTLKMMQVMENQIENKKLKNIAGSIAQDIIKGESLFSGFKKHPGTFSNLYCSMVKAGEASGRLPEVLDRLIYIIEHEYKLKTDISAALMYPVIVLCCLVAAFFLLLTLVIPKFVNIFIKSGIDIPLPTQICIFMYKFMIDYWYLAAGLAAVIITAFFSLLRTASGRYTFDALLMKLPLIGSMFIKSAMSRFAGIFSILQSSGVSALESMRILAGTISNKAIAREFELVTERLEEGRGIADPLKSAKYFTPMVTNMVAIGEESGNLDEMLGEISDHYDVELEYNIKRLSEAIGPILTVGMAVVVGFFAFAIFLPMWDMVQIAH